MKPRVYVETTIISYLTSRPSRDIVSLARQEVTREWWHTRRSDFEVVISGAVVQEASQGNKEVAIRRLAALAGIPEVEIGPSVLDLAEKLVEAGPIPANSKVDALHIAAAVNASADFLLTWNFKHMANVFIRTRIEKALAEFGFIPCRICTPEELVKAEEP